MDFSSEKITLQHGEINTFHFLEHPHGGFLLSYLPKNSPNIFMMQQEQNKSEWKFQIPQNESNFQQLAESWSKIEGFSSCFDNKGDLLRFFNTKTHEGQVKLFSTSSHSYGKQWNSPKELTDELQSWKIDSSPIKIKAGLNVGQILLSVENPQLKRAMTIFTKDNGNTWNFSLFVEPQDFEEETNDVQENGSFSPVTLELKENNLKMYCRILDKPGVLESMSYDMGSTWSVPISTNLEEISKEGAFSAYCVSDLDRNIKQILMLGTLEDENQLTPTLWHSKDEGKTFEIIWKSPISESVPLKHCLIFLDKEKYIHWLFNSTRNIIRHYWTHVSNI